MKTFTLLGELVLAAVLLMATLIFVQPALATCTPSETGTGGPDTITCNGDTSTNVNSGPGSDTITNNGNLNGNINAGAGPDTVNNNGTVNGNVNGGLGSDTITNNGTVNGNVLGSGGSDTIINNGTINGGIGSVLGPASSNTVENNGTINGNIYLGPGTNTVTVTENGQINGIVIDISCGCGNNTLIIHGSVSEDEFDSIMSQIPANAEGGSITINGRTFTWTDGVQLRAILRRILIGFHDGRINPRDLQQSMTGWCVAKGGLELYTVDKGVGKLIGTVTGKQLADAVAQAVASGKHILITAKDGRELWALKSNELQLHDARGIKYNFVFPALRCGLAS